MANRAKSGMCTVVIGCVGIAIEGRAWALLWEKSVGIAVGEERGHCYGGRAKELIWGG